MSDTPKCPTTEQCTKNERVTDEWGRPAFAVWYPQMGGYAGRAVMVLGREGENCFDVWVWHDGAFPFDEDGREEGARPAFLHHCMASQFIDFGRTVLKLQGAEEET